MRIQAMLSRWTWRSFIYYGEVLGVLLAWILGVLVALEGPVASSEEAAEPEDLAVASDASAPVTALD